ncbi:tRNA (adenosine(37)-N6)-threonylcarbamoyltransferase complex ATPase subunit type 1 TsaE [Leeuwenhoekiella sp. H156]|uniref:tRNA (adenosine(37)-N6)-threonylcarbamoyltransferase complex ATPase subunit type 1 TsaE n=1 Tax=Leeuwenhoekiella sp. H156 TaxID=3450128 RepID=UPI003FA4A817
MTVEYRLKEVDQIAKQILELSNYKTILFQGNLGSGKTTLIKALVKNLGSEDYVSSPTFSLLNEYKTEDGETIYHMDLYRLKNEIEAFDMGLEEILENDSWKFIEWPDKINSLLGTDYHSATIISTKENFRHLEFN